MKQFNEKSLLDPYIKLITRLRVDQHIPGATRTHKIRVGIKRLRARLALLDALTGKCPESAALNQSLKQFSDYLSAHRDRDVMLALLDSIAQQADDDGMKSFFSQARTWLEDQARPPPLDLDVIEVMCADILDAYQQLPAVEIRASAIRAWLKSRLRKLRRKKVHELNSDDCARLHKWRKQVKRLYYQNEVVKTVGKKHHQANRALGKLGDRLGELHDCCVLEARLRSKQAGALPADDSADYARACALLDRMRARLLKRCQRLHDKYISG